MFSYISLSNTQSVFHSKLFTKSLSELIDRKINMVMVFTRRTLDNRNSFTQLTSGLNLHLQLIQKELIAKNRPFTFCHPSFSENVNVSESHQLV